ncbi:MAPK/MAK/MRK overlapping kinase-like isoform X1 [Atheta coriaria]|uniref:MAPK/MAK/MRK overlapping kinase-like isoform X1 n=1 Tax=Dalotia coriaria TaxID=877792 RepID=UPI0031F41772
MEHSSIKINKSLSYPTISCNIMPSFISKYKIIQKIGEGSFSEVLKCEDRATKQLYAAKILKKFFTGSNDVLYCAEIIAMQKLNKHPNVLYMHDYFFEKGSGKLIFIFELMDMSMYEFMKSRKRSIPEARVKNYLYQILKGLDYLHRHGLFHRDIKPENILVKVQNPGNTNTTTQQPIELIKLADLGSIRGIYSKPPYTEYISTRWYRSPECLLTIGHYGPKMDIWATGCVFYEVLTMRPLFPGNNEIDQLAKIHAVLGTPSTRLLGKLKSRSKNLQNFTKSIGIGLGTLIKTFSEDAQTILKLMLQYDPDIRSNARRLLQHRYFSAIMDEEKCKKSINRTYASRDHGDNTSIPAFGHTFSNKPHLQMSEGAPKPHFFTSRTAIELNQSRNYATSTKPNMKTYSEKHLSKTWQTTQQQKLKAAYHNALFRNTTSNISKKLCEYEDSGNRQQETRLLNKRVLPQDKCEAKRIKMLN